ncbi:hNH endonuclease [Escherichia coli]|nr:hNH endonuclease [Escherichia coli]
MKQMTLIEMDGFLKGKCIPRDLKVNETNAEYLVRKFAEAEAKCAALAAENARLKAICEDRRTFIMNGVQLGFIKVPTVEIDPALETIRIALSPQKTTPATDAFLAEVRASELDSLAGLAETMLVKFSNQQCSSDMHEVVGWKMVLQQANNRASQLRKGGNQ